MNVEPVGVVNWIFKNIYISFLVKILKHVFIDIHGIGLKANNQPTKLVPTLSHALGNYDLSLSLLNNFEYGKLMEKPRLMYLEGTLNSWISILFF